MRRRHAFSLIEILVVITIVTLLIALLLPALATARTTSHMVQSLSNQKQVTTAMFAYSEDNKTSLPFSLSGGNYIGTPPNLTLVSSVIPTWGWTLYNQGYVAGIEVYFGTGRDVHGMDFATMRSTGSTSDWYYMSYGANIEALTTYAESVPAWQLAYNGNSYPTGMLPTRLGDAKTPPADRFLLLCEVWTNSNSYTKGYAGAYRIQPQNIFTNPSFVNLLPYNYNGVVPRAFVDGHCVADSGASMGWNPNLAPPAGAGITTPTSPGPYAGNWTYTTPTQFKTSPWYAQYRR